MYKPIRVWLLIPILIQRTVICKLILGVHFTISKGFAYAARTVSEMGAGTFQFFCRNPRGSKIKNYDEKDVSLFQKIRKENNMGPFMAHAPYTINLASAKEETSEFAREAVKEDLKRMEKLGIEYFNLHPGSHVGSGIKTGTANIIKNLNTAMEGIESITVLLETMSGKGSEVGFRFEQLREIIDGIELKDRVGVCMDLCHVFAAGYDITGGFDGVLECFDKAIGIDRLKAVHLNDSMFPMGSGKDRHMPVGEGEIGLNAILNIIAHPAMKNLPFYLETPLDDEGHKNEIQNVLKLAQSF